MKTERMVLHDMPYVVVTAPPAPPVAYPAASWDADAQRPMSDDVEQCDCLETAVDYYRLRRERLYSEGTPVLSERDTRVLDALLDIHEGRPRKPRHSRS
jgi:hypothetical protein